VELADVAAIRVLRINLADSRDAVTAAADWGNPRLREAVRNGLSPHLLRVNGPRGRRATLLCGGTGCAS
jgi:hypothetical protein